MAMSDEIENEKPESAALPWSSIDPQDNFADEPVDSSEAAPRGSGGGWTIAVLCIGLSLIAACVIIPQADANRRLAYERQRLRRDLDQIQKQVAVNSEFLHQ